MKQLGVTPHGLRHQFAGDLYVEITQLQAPIRGVDMAVAPTVLKTAYLEVARQLHNWPQISKAYLGTATQAVLTDTHPPPARRTT